MPFFKIELLEAISWTLQNHQKLAKNWAEMNKNLSHKISTGLILLNK